MHMATNLRLKNWNSAALAILLIATIASAAAAQS
jgi:hypothetical protein